MESRHSRGLEQIISSLQDREGLRVLDLAGARTETIAFLANMGHRVTSDDIQHALDTAFGGGDFLANQEDPERIDKFAAMSLDYPEQEFDATLAWDSLQYFTPKLMGEVVGQLHRIMRPGAQLLAMFHAETTAGQAPLCYYRIADAKNIQILPKGGHRPYRFLNNREIEKAFVGFSSVKFFLTRDHLREVIVTR